MMYRMKRILVLCAVCLLMGAQGVMAEYNDSIRVSAGTLFLYDPFDQESGGGGQLTLGYPVKPGVELEFYGAQSTDFSAGNDLTDGDVAISIVTLGGRCLSARKGDSAGYVSFGMGVMQLDADNSPEGDDGTRNGGVARLGVGLDHWMTPDLGLSWGAGFARGFGATDEISLFEVSASLFFTL